MPATRVASHAYVNPLVAVALGYFVAGSHSRRGAARRRAGRGGCLPVAQENTRGKDEGSCFAPENNAMAILREWRAEIRRALRDEYVEYVTATGLAAYRATPGNLGASIGVRDLDSERSEIVTLSWWTHFDAIRHSPAAAIDRARCSRRCQLLLARPERVLTRPTISMRSGEVEDIIGAPSGTSPPVSSAHGHRRFSVA